MAHTSPFTAIAGNTILETDWNISGRDNLIAQWVYTVAGDIAIASSSTVLTALAKPSGRSILQMTGAPVASWLPFAALGGIHAKAQADFNTGQGGTGAGNWIDITNSGITLTLTVTCTIILFASVAGYCDNTDAISWRAVIDGTTATQISQNNGISGGRNEAAIDIYYKTGVAAGARSTKLQFSDASGQNTQGRCIALAFVEP